MKKNYLLLPVLVLLAFLMQECRKELPVQDNNKLLAVDNSNLQALAASATPMQVYGVWHAGNDYCDWATERTVTEFSSKNAWLVNGNSGKPSVNLVILSFVHPLKLLNHTTDAGNLNGMPRGMTPAIINYFKSYNIRVMLSIGGITYTDAWDEALKADATQLGLNAADVAIALGVGIEIDYEQNRNPNLAGLQQFIDAYRSRLPYDATGNNPAARLTIDLAAGDRWLIDICRKATADWLTTGNPVLDYANAMVPARQPKASDAIANWQEHVNGKPQYGPPIPPLAPAKFTGSLWLVGNKPLAECINFDNSIQKSTGSFVQSVLPNGSGTTAGMLGYMFWAAECEGTRTICTTPPNGCDGGIGKGAAYFNIPVPMPALRQQ